MRTAAEFNAKHGVELSCSSEAVALPVADAMLIALIAGELITNAYKHGRLAAASKILISLPID